MRALTDPRLRRAVPNHWPSRCTVQTKTYTTQSSGQKKWTGNADVVGLTSLECRLGPLHVAQPSNDQRRSDGAQSATEYASLLINKFIRKDLFVVGEMTLLVDGVRHKIVGAENDSQLLFTRLRLENEVV